MVWALLAAFLHQRSPRVQAAVFGACTGLFVDAQADVVAGSLPLAALLVLAVAVPAGSAFFVALRARLRIVTAHPDIRSVAPASFAAAWLVFVAAAARALVAEGPQVAVLAIVPIVLLAPPVLAGLPALPGRRPSNHASIDDGSTKKNQSPSA
jgi:hypothetical protein